MLTRRRGLLALIGSGLAALLIPGRGAAARPAAAFQGLEGTWVSTARGGDPTAPQISHTTFTGDGTYIVTATNFPRTSNGQGVWMRTGEREFAGTHVSFRYDERGSYEGTTKVRTAYRLNETFDEYATEAVAEWLDLIGNVTNTTRRLATGRRVRVELQ